MSTLMRHDHDDRRGEGRDPHWPALLAGGRLVVKRLLLMLAFLLLVFGLGIGHAQPPEPININTANAAELDRLPRVGPVIAERIIEFREENGPFASVDDLVRVRGIGAKTLEQIRPHAKVEDPE